MPKSEPPQSAEARDSQDEWVFFISHASSDHGDAKRLYEMLSGSYPTFLASACLAPGSIWESALLRAAQNSKIIVPLVSSSTDTAYYQRAEIDLAVDLARAYPDSYKVVPVDLDGTMASHGAPLSLRLFQRLTAAELGNLQDVASRLLNLAVELSEIVVEHPGELPPNHVLHQYPKGPYVTKQIDRTILYAYAELMNSSEAASLIDEAAELRRTADPDDSTVTVVHRGDLPSPNLGLVNYWRHAFAEARKHGPRMVAALFHVVPDGQFDADAKRKRRELLDYLASGVRQ